MSRTIRDGTGLASEIPAWRLTETARKTAPRPRCVHRWFEAQAARSPDAPAVDDGTHSLTYRQLNARANQIARQLRDLGVGPELLVGLYLHRSVNLLAALLGILKAGGAYVPLDPAYPTDRLAMMLDDAHPAVVVTEDSLRETLPATDSACLVLDGHPPTSASIPDDNLPAGATPANLAYVIYTSGSTGKPKGVEISHAALANLLASMRTILGIEPDDALLALTTLSFDIAALELLLPLVSGARVELVDRETAADASGLMERLRDAEIRFIQATPATWRMLLDAGWRGKPGLTMLCGGEAMPRALADRLLDRGGTLWNVYGPTETTIWSSAWRVEPGDGPISIGKPIANTQLYVLNPVLEPVPPGVTGELYIGGVGLARGYRGRPALTAERFVPDPFARRPGARLYRTGDLARWRPDGTLECLGRVDHQVKIRGFRIELGEIESALSAHPAVRQAVVITREYAPDDFRLVAYLTAHENAPAVAELRRYLKIILPDYMIPSAFVSLESIPKTPNGKVDRASLPAPEGGRSASVAFVAPRSPIEELLAGVWSSVLGVERIGAFDNFFDLGGHSLLATQVASRLRDAIGLDLPLREFFGDPTIAGVARRIEERTRAEAGLETPPLVPIESNGPVPTSFSQQALWFLDQLAPGQATFNITLAGRVRGPLDRDLLGRCFAEIIRRHGTLRTTFASVDGEPVQIVADTIDLPITTTDLRALHPSTREPEARRLAVQEARRPFDLARGPLARVHLVAISDDDHAVLLTMHHIIGDGWSLGVAARELATLYEAYRRGESSPLEPLPIQYTDYSRWQHRLLDGDRRNRLVDYWTRQLSGVSPLELPTDRPRPPIRTSRGDFLSFSIPDEVAAQLRDLGRRAGATPFMVLLAAFQAMLHRYSGQDDIVVGSPIANRNRSEVEGLIGYFVNMLALRTDLSGDPTFLALVRRVREVALAAYEHQDLPLEKVVEAIRPARDPSRTPLFQVMFVLQNNQIPVLSHSELTVGPLDLDEGTGTAKFDLTVSMAEAGTGMVGGFEFNTDLFDRSTIERMSDHFIVLLAGIATDPDRRISALPMVDETERARLVALGAGPRIEIDPTAFVHRLIEAQAARTPDAVAVEAGDRLMTYRELNERANQLARELKARGIGPDRLVGVGLLRSTELAVALLATLKAGGAFVPLDPDYPTDRLAAMLEDSRASILLTQEALADRWPATDADLLRLDVDRDPIDRHPTGNLDDGPTPNEAAYVIYTSGSTGEPRGVVVRHGGLLHHNLAVASSFGIGPEDRILQFSSLSFDIAIEELFPAWIQGATVVFRDEGPLPGPSEFAADIEARRITVLDLPTVFWHAWVEGLATIGGMLPNSLRLVVVGGEKASARRFADWSSIGGDRVRWINTYGPTEATVVATLFEPNPASAPAEMPIGQPIAGTRIYLLDRHLEPVPQGLPGELYIGGEGVARGYLRRPSLTADRFLPDPFAERTGARMFRTGDRARWRPDGQLEFLGRLDHQVKIRGFRVEPGEIESVLRRHPTVGDAIVLAREIAGGGRRLAAYVVPRASTAPDVDDIRRWVRSALPDYMVPSAITTLDAWPLSPNGKIDRRALPDPGPLATGPDAGYVAPRTPIEETMARVWAEVMERDRVGIHDNFFDLGGHSLQSVQLVSRLSAALGRPIQVKTVFQAPTIAEMAAILEREPIAPAGPDPATITRWLLDAPAPDLPEHVAIEGRPFDSLIASGELAAVDAAAISYFPASLLHGLGLDRETITRDWCRDRPVIADVRQAPMGRIATILIPRFEDQLYLDRADLLARLVDAVRLAGSIGASTVSLTGLLPSASDYGRDLASVLDRRGLPRITTGHATTTSAVVLAIRRALEEAGRDLASEHVGFVGVGSVGLATLRLMLSCLPHSPRLTLCDVFARRPALESLRRELAEELGYRGEVRILASAHEVPDEMYEASLIVGATNVAEILDIHRVAPGTIVVDDSAPHVFRPDAAFRRLEERGDILVTEGGLLQAPEPLPVLAYLPDGLEPWLRAGLLHLVARTDPGLITGCVLSGLLSARFEHLTPTIGLVDRRTALDHYETLDAMGFRSPDLQLGGTPIDPAAIAGFRARFGRGRADEGSDRRWA